MTVEWHPAPPLSEWYVCGDCGGIVAADWVDRHIAWHRELEMEEYG